MLVDFPLLEAGKRYRVLRGFQDLRGQHLIAGMEARVIALEYSAGQLALVCQATPKISQSLFFAVQPAELDEALERLAEHFEAIDTHVREPLAASAAEFATVADQHRESDPLIARSAYRLAMAQYAVLAATAANPAAAADARQLAARMQTRLEALPPR